MKTSKISPFLTSMTFLLAGVSLSEVAVAAGGGHGGWRGGGGWQGGGGVRVGVYLGVPVGLGSGYGYGAYRYSYYRAPYYGGPAYYPPVIYTERSDDPQIYAQVAPVNSTQSAQDSWWHYCADSKAFYPYVIPFRIKNSNNVAMINQGANHGENSGRKRPIGNGA